MTLSEEQDPCQVKSCCPLFVLQRFVSQICCWNELTQRSLMPDWHKVCGALDHLSAVVRSDTTKSSCQKAVSHCARGPTFERIEPACTIFFQVPKRNHESASAVFFMLESKVCIWISLSCISLNSAVSEVRHNFCFSHPGKSTQQGSWDDAQFQKGDLGFLLLPVDNSY